MLQNVSGNRDAFLKLMKFTKQSPTFSVETDEILSTMDITSLSKFGYNHRKYKAMALFYFRHERYYFSFHNVILFQVRMDNAFIAMCKFGNDVNIMTMWNCHHFKRSFTNQGLGYTFNNEQENNLIREDFKSLQFFTNTARDPSFMKSASPEHSLRVVIESNAEQIQNFRDHDSQTIFEPKEVKVSLHNPKEPADIRSKSFNIPLGFSTTVYITPKARIIDKDGKLLTEPQRSCRLDEDTDLLDIFMVYTKSACMMECKMKYAERRCGCVPWNYPHKFKTEVNLP